MLKKLVLLRTPVAMFCLSGAPMTSDDLHLVSRAQSAGGRAVVVTTFPAAYRP
jgi:hypothetical protein